MDTRICKTCGVSNADVAFASERNSCRPCFNKRGRAFRSKYQALYSKNPLPILEKRCKKCKRVLAISKFYRSSTEYGGWSGGCIDCHRKIAKKFRSENRGHYLARSRRYYVKFQKKRLEEKVDYYKKNRAALIKKAAAYKRNRMKIDPAFRAEMSLRGRVSAALRKEGVVKSKFFRELVGCDIEFFKKYIEKHFRSGMSWNNYGYYGWHIDHIRPCSSFDLTDPKQQKECFHYTNLQPLWAKENLSKNDKIPEGLTVPQKDAILVH